MKEEIKEFLEQHSKGIVWDAPYWISFLNAFNDDLCPHEECPEEVGDFIKNCFGLTTGICLSTASFNWENANKIAELITEHFAKEWYKYHVQRKGGRALDFEEYKSELEDLLVDGSGPIDDDLFLYDEISGETLDSWPVNEDSCIDELNILVENETLTEDEWKRVYRIGCNFYENEQIKALIEAIVWKN